MKQKRKICVVTGTRADYGLLYWLMRKIKEDKDLELQILVTGMHLSPEFGLTYRNIEKDGFHITKKVEVLLSSDTPIGISKAIGLGQISFSEAFAELRPDMIVVLGDRFEIFAAVTSAMVLRIPIAHCHGGEATEGLIDESIRHSITKMSHLHFAASEEYRNRIIQLGEQPNTVFNVGALGIENINKLKLLNRKEFERSIDFKMAKRNILVTFHPVTLETNTAEKQFNELLAAIRTLKNTNAIFTKPNADTEGRIIIDLIDSYVSENPGSSVSFVSLGQLRYLSALKHVDVMVGNSSSGLIEAPSFGIATINIGDRQKGRLKADSVIDCDPTFSKIVGAFKKAFSTEFKEVCNKTVNPYGKKNASDKIVHVLKTIDLEGILKKDFFDIEFIERKK